MNARRWTFADMFMMTGCTVKHARAKPQLMKDSGDERTMRKPRRSSRGSGLFGAWPVFSFTSRAVATARACRCDAWPKASVHDQQGTSPLINVDRSEGAK